MARAQDQAAWRQKTGRRRVEVYLPAEAAAELDRRAAEAGESRAQVLAALLAPQEAQEAPEGMKEAQERDPDTLDWLEAQEVAQPPLQASQRAALPAYRRRRAPGAGPGGIDAEWIEVAGERVGRVWHGINDGWEAQPGTRASGQRPYHRRTRAAVIEAMLRCEGFA